MQNLLKKILSLFTKKEDPHGLGAILNEPDNRDIPYPAVAGAVPETFPAQISVPGALTLIRLLQGNLGTCVEHCLEFIKRAEDGVVHSRRVPYVITRNELGWNCRGGAGPSRRKYCNRIRTRCRWPYYDQPPLASSPIENGLWTNAQ